MRNELSDQPTRTASTRMASEEIARRHSWRRPKDGKHPEDWQIGLRARKHPEMFAMPEPSTLKLLDQGGATR
jgi:hypothetical protein